MPRLIMKRGPEPGRVYELSGDVIVVGRGAKNDIVLQDNEVSRNHCRFLRVMTDYELHDLDSANGTFVNGQRVLEPWLLQSDCIIELGDSITFQFERESSSDGAKIVSEVATVSPNDLNIETAESQRIESAHHLVVRIGSRTDTVEIFTLEDEQIKLGRDLSNQIVIQEPEVSRYHLTFTRTDQGYTVEDMGSTNGTLLNGSPLTDLHLLHHEDVLQIGTIIDILYTANPNLYKSNIKTDYLPTDEATRLAPPNRKTVPVKILGENVASKRKTSLLGTGLEPGALADHLFIAYARDDWDSLVAPLVMSLQDASLKVWVEQYLKPGHDDWVVAVEQALSECWLMVVIVSPPALDSKNVTMQYRYFYNREKPIVPLLYKPVMTLPPELIKQRSVRYDANDHTRSFQRLIFEIMHSRKK